MLGGVLRRRFRFALQPLRDVVQIAGSSEHWKASGADPGVLLLPGRGGYPSGWVLLQSSLQRHGASRVARLYYDVGAGFNDAASVIISASLAGRINEVFRLPRGVLRLRWDPMESKGEIRQGPLVITEITWLENVVRKFVRVLLMRKKQSAQKRLTWREIVRLLTNLDREYDRAAIARIVGGTPHIAHESARGPASRPLLIQHVRPNAGRLLDVGPREPETGSYRFHLDVLTEQEASGWVVDPASPDKPVELDLYVNDELVERKTADLERIDVAAVGLGGPRCGFRFSIPQRLRGSGAKVTLFPSGSRVPLGGCSYIHVGRDLLVRGLLTAVEALNRPGDSSGLHLSSSLHAGEHGLTAIRQIVFPRLLKQLRADWQDLPDVLAVPERSAPDAERVDVIIPAYRGLDETVACIQSVMGAKGGTSFDLIVLNDGSPEPELTAALRLLSAEHGFLLIENPANLGFVRTVNKGMMLHGERDVVLLNSDTVVSDGWLDRLRGAAYSAPNIGTATPISNRATILSFPRSNFDNDLPDGVSIARMAAACAKANDRVVIDIPTAIGFCMYIRRAALREAGHFDEALWDKGYGEENDFCLRASNIGWRHVAACDAFVLHHGSVSFAGEQESRKSRNLDTLNRIYPDYNATIARFIQTDPLETPRRRLFVELARSRAPRYMLFLMHSWGGGAEVAAMDLAKRLADSGEAVLFLTTQAADAFTLGVFGTNLAVEYRGPEQYADVLSDLRQLRVWHAHLHQLPGFSADVYDLLPKLGVPYDVTIHDYYYICPRIHLVDGSQAYCGEPDERGCNTCLKMDGAHESCRDVYRQFGSSIGGWRARNAELLGHARLVIAPSRDTENRMRKYFPLRNILVKPHPGPAGAVGARRGGSGGSLTVAVVGAIGIHKGFNVLKACAQDAKTRSLPIRFVVVGYTCDDSQFGELDNVVITGPYDRDDLGGILGQYDCTVAAFFNLVPETFSYTLSEAWTNGLFPLVFDLGAQAERVRAAGFGVVLPLSSSAAAINDAFIESAKRLRSLEPARVMGTTYTDVLADYYRIQPGARGPVESGAFARGSLG